VQQQIEVYAIGIGRMDRPSTSDWAMLILTRTL
jgi:hypothetical protein